MDEILSLFLKTQREEAAKLASESDLLDFHVLDDQRFVARYACRGLVRAPGGDVREHDGFGVGIWLRENYLRFVNPAELLTWLEPGDVWHPNIAPPYVCLGHVVPGTPLVDLLHRCFELITYQNVTMREDDALNRPACAWARGHRARLPIDPRPIKRRPTEPARCAAEGTP